MIEQVILENLLHNEDYLRRVLPFLKDEYFAEGGEATVYKKINDFTVKYNKAPTQDELIIELKDTVGISQATYEQATDLVKELSKRSKAPSIDWLLEHTEKFCKDRALYNAIAEAATAIDNQDADLGKLPDILKDALSVSFDTAIGHDFTNAIEERYKLLHQSNVYKIPFDIDILNKITGGGLPKKTLAVIAASTGAGKSLALCHFAAQAMLSGKKVLYITMEMAEEKISERIDANLMRINLQDMPGVSLQEYKRKLGKALDGCEGRLIVKEYPTAGAGVTQFRALVNELKLKKDFHPDMIIVDYVNICSSSRYKAAAVNSYQYVKAICEELRGLAIEYDLPILSATQLNREGTDNSDAGLKEISESHGLAMTVDLLLAMIRSEELDDQNLVMFKQLKNRFSDMAAKLRFVVGIDRSKMLLFNAEAEPNMAGSKVVSNGTPPTRQQRKEMVDTSTGEVLNRKPSYGQGAQRSKFEGIKV